MRRVYAVGQTASPHPLAIADAALSLRAGALALLPTETVYGVGVAVSAFGLGEAGAPEPADGTGYGRIFTLKHRERSQTVPWLVADPEALDAFGRDIPDALRDLASVFWPGALTIVVPASDAVPRFMCAADGTVALRASASPVIQSLIRACSSPLAVTSANTHGRPAPVSFDGVEPRVLSGVDIAFDAGATPCQDASTIVAWRDGAISILRRGALAAQRIVDASARPRAASNT